MSTLNMAYHGLSKVISGGQTGVDQGALFAAHKHGVATGGWAPKGYRTSLGRMPILRAFGLEEDGSADYGPRTKRNLIVADATLVIAVNLQSPGTKMTIDLCHANDKAMHIIQVTEAQVTDSGDDWQWDLVDVAYDFLKKHQVRTLNVAGHREISHSTAMFDLSHGIIARLLLTFDNDNLLVRDSDL
jgi:hypothetical protein